MRARRQTRADVPCHGSDEPRMASILSSHMQILHRETLPVPKPLLLCFGDAGRKPCACHNKIVAVIAMRC